ncbi:hypothetical protein DD237_008459 [Peronospora effusa]|uniref:Uncharacterized protein n=1 Tax=Peronospora effusa TaxID=542832 RepID=A0A3R8CME8_9STRA|nr:hypothetical protein DD237_008459 [Peronospora effusa]
MAVEHSLSEDSERSRGCQSGHQKRIPRCVGEGSEGEERQLAKWLAVEHSLSEDSERSRGCQSGHQKRIPRCVGEVSMRN